MIPAGTIAGGNPAHPRNKSDHYPTPPEVTEALLNFLQIPIDKKIWEPACGKGYMSRLMEEYGYQVYSTDIQEKGYGWCGKDFLDDDYPRNFDWIITNPPFSKSTEFIERAHSLGKPFAFLLKAQYWNAAKRVQLFREMTPTLILPIAWRPDFKFDVREPGTRASPLMDVAWNVWIPTTDEMYLRHRNVRFMPLDHPRAIERKASKVKPFAKGLPDRVMEIARTVCE